jgi:NHLM bacteriocin system ABC transporter ATP-binding protein
MISVTLIPMPLRMTLDDPAQAWRIVSGSVDLFLVDLSGTVAQSGLDYLGTLGAGSILLGVGGVVSHGIETTVVAQAATQTMLQPMRLATAPEEFDEVDPEQLESWITRLSAWCAPGLAPTQSVQVEAGQQIDSGEDGMTLVGGRSVAWITGSLGTLSLYEPSSAQHLAAVPVCRYLWATATPGQTVSCLSTAQWLTAARANDNTTQDLAIIHAALLTQRRDRRLRTDAHERTRFQQKVQRDGRVFAHALRELATPLLPTATNLPGQATGATGAVEACQAVGSVMGIDIVAPEPIPNESAEQSVLRIASASSVRYRQVLLRQAWWKHDQGPMIGFTLNGVSAVAFLAKSSRSYVMFDPVAGTSVPMTAELSASLDARAYVLYRPFPNRKLTARDLLLFGLRNGRRDLLTILAVGAMTGLLGLAMPIATGVLFDQIIPEGQRNNLVQLSILLFSASIAIFLMNLGQSFATQRLEGRMESEMEAAVWDRLLNLPTRFFRQFTTGDLAARSLAVNQIRQALTQSASTALLSGVFSLFSFALLFSYSGKLALAATALSAFAITFSALSTFVMVRLDRRLLAMQGAITGRVAELLQGVAKFRVSGTEPRAFARWAHDYTRQRRTMLTVAKVSMATTIFNTVFPTLTAIVLYILAANMARQDPTFSTGHFLAFNAAFGQFLGATLAFSAALLSLVSVVPTYERAKPILEELPELKANLKKPGKLRGDIEASHLIFRYHQDGPVILHDVSFTIRSGQYVALVGESGCGKSTLMRLLLGFERPEAGSIYYDGQDLAELDMQSLRRQIGVVLQAGKLMAADIFTNIVGASLLTMDDAWAAAESVGLADDIRAMPMGMHTVINESGSGLSGGQRQRILIARSVVHRPRILFFDEATSALDNQTQAIVSRSLDAMQATRIVIAHRLSTIRHADLILVFKAGRLHESGTFEDLLNQNGHFAELAKRQMA